jgi:urea transport system permease protein
LGAVLVNYGKTYLTGAIPEIWLFALGALFIGATLFLPKGIIGSLPAFPGLGRAKADDIRNIPAAAPVAGKADA